MEGLTRDVEIRRKQIEDARQRYLNAKHELQMLLDQATKDGIAVFSEPILKMRQALIDDEVCAVTDLDGRGLMEHYATENFELCFDEQDIIDEYSSIFIDDKDTNDTGDDNEK